MSFLGDIWAQYQSTISDPVLVEEKVEPFLRSLTAFLNAIEAKNSLDSFCFSVCAMDVNDANLYALIKFSRESTSTMVIPLTREDLNNLDQAVSRIKDWNLEPHIRDFANRTESVVKLAMHEMDLHERTAEWVCRRKGVQRQYTPVRNIA